MYLYTFYAKLLAATRGLFCAHSLAPSDLNLDSMHYNHGFLNGNTNPLCQRGHFPPHKTHFNSTSSHYASTLIETANIFRGSCSIFVLCMYDKAKAYACVCEMCSNAGWRLTVAIANIHSAMVRLFSINNRRRLGISDACLLHDTVHFLDVISLNYFMIPLIH